ncbi:MAG TPA: CocE/NonD family hydrolase [Actinomycetota bacterium]|nr:CocE/NonD family hydrolase [Actinomycetota bacterium]
MSEPSDVRVVREFPFDVERTAHVWIPLADGTRLAARLWRPHTDRPVPAILEYLPYRKGDAMAARDEPLGSWFAGHGYAYCRVDVRGTGDSDGVITDEYAPQEQDDGVEVIAWLAAQTWCTGAVGMIGISWGGFNGLQIAARRPPALAAVISMCSTDDRYADDVHYDGGCVLAWDMVPWHAVMLSLNALPPDPATVGDSWRDTWLRRLDQTPPFLAEWMSHQRRDGYWRHGSVCEDFAAIRCPVYMVGGWADGYTNAIPRTLAGLPGIRKGLIGPWPHSWPHTADQGPRIDFLHEALRWWDRWLKDEPNAIEAEPMLRAWMQEPALAGELHLDRPGRWLSEPAWPPPSVHPTRRFLTPSGGLADDAPVAGTLQHRGVQRHGAFAGTWCPYGPEADLPPDQREEDALCLTFETEPLRERLELLGHPRLRLRVAADRPLAFVIARLCDVSPDGTSTLLSRGALNLAHRDGHDAPAPLDPGTPVDVDIELDVLGQAIVAGDRLRLAISSTYWPWLWPSPETVTLTVEAGAGSWLELPVRPLGAPDGPAPAFGDPETAPSLAVEDEVTVPAFHRLHRDLVTGEVTMELNQDGDKRMSLPDGLTLIEENHDRFDIVEGDPLSASVTSTRRLRLERGGWRVEVRTTSRMTADGERFFLADRVETFESDRPVFDRTWEREVPRDHV